MKVGMEEALTRFDAHASQNEASYDGDVSDAGEDDTKVVPDEVDYTCRSKARSQWEPPQQQGRKFERLPTRAVTAKPQNLQTRIELVNPATRLYLGEGMGLSAMIEASSLRDAGTNIQKTTFQSTVSSRQVAFSL